MRPRFPFFLCMVCRLFNRFHFQYDQKREIHSRRRKFFWIFQESPAHAERMRLLFFAGKTLRMT